MIYSMGVWEAREEDKFGPIDELGGWDLGFSAPSSSTVRFGVTYEDVPGGSRAASRAA
jgi:hypothetical protein